MTAFATLPVDDSGTLGAIRNLLARLMERGAVRAVLVPTENHDGSLAQPALIADPAKLGLANPIMPVMAIHMARMVSLLTQRDLEPTNGKEPSGERIAVVMRPCELRAAIELAKLQQIEFGQLLTVGIDCVGTYEAHDFEALSKEQGSIEASNAVLCASRKGVTEAPGAIPYRNACAICETPVAWAADVAIHTVGVGDEGQVLVEVADQAHIEMLGLAGDADASAHRQSVEAFTEIRREKRKKELDAFEEQLKPADDGMPGLISVFQTCRSCHNCTVACPICYCKECLFRTETMAYEPSRYFGWAKRKGAARLPGDTIAFQLTRLTHVTTACVGCGLCTSACPSRLPVDTLFQAVARKTQKLFDYVPGRNLEERPPRGTFRRDEFVTLGESEH